MKFTVIYTLAEEALLTLSKVKVQKLRKVLCADIYALLLQAQSQTVYSSDKLCSGRYLET